MTTFGDFILIIFSIIIIIGMLGSIFYVLYGGLLLILSGGDDEKIKIGVNTIRYAILGLVVIVISIYIFPIAGRLLGLDFYGYTSANVIIDKIKEIYTIIM